MSERIREMLPNPFAVDYEVTNDTNGLDLYTEDQLVRFAEKIVHECMGVCRIQRNPQNLNYKPSEEFANAIGMHFGVRQ